MIEIIVAVISGGAVTSGVLWLMFFKWKKGALLSQLKVSATKNDIDTYTLLGDSIRDLREEVEKLSADRHAITLELDRIKILNKEAAHHWKAIAANCRCNQSQEVEEARKFFEKYEQRSSS